MPKKAKDKLIEISKNIIPKVAEVFANKGKSNDVSKKRTSKKAQNKATKKATNIDVIDAKKPKKEDKKASKSVSKKTTKKEIKKTDKKETAKIEKKATKKKATTKVASVNGAKKVANKVANKTAKSNSKKEASKTDKTSTKSVATKAKKITPTLVDSKSNKKTENKKATSKKQNSDEAKKIEKNITPKASNKTESIKPTKAPSKTAKSKTTKVTDKNLKTTKTAKTANKTAKSKTSNAKVVKTKKATRKKTSKAITIGEYYDLPTSYDQTVVKILAQTPTILFVYWDISEKDRKNLIKKYGEDFFEKTYPYLIVINRTKNYQYEVEVNDYANSWYLHIPDSDCKYEVILMRRNRNSNIIAENELTITSSNEMDSPNDHILFEKLGKTVFFKDVKNGNVMEKDISSFSFMHNIGRIYNIYDLYKEIYKNELNGDELGVSLTSSHFSSNFK